MDLPDLWASIEADLARARSTLPDDSANHESICEYQDFLNHNELELACDMLEDYAKDHQVSREFWLALCDAATRMQLPRANRYKENARGTSDKF